MRTYTAASSQVVCSAVQDIISIRPPSAQIVRIIEVRVSQSTSTTSTQQRVRMSRLSATVTAGSGGSSVTPAKHESGDAAAASTVRANDTTQATTNGTKTTIFEDVFNIVSGYLWVPVPEEYINVAPGEAFVLEFPAAPGGQTFDASVTFQEIG